MYRFCIDVFFPCFVAFSFTEIMNNLYIRLRHFFRDFRPNFDGQLLEPSEIPIKKQLTNLSFFVRNIKCNNIRSQIKIETNTPFFIVLCSSISENANAAFSSIQYVFQSVQLKEQVPLMFAQSGQKIFLTTKDPIELAIDLFM